MSVGLDAGFSFFEESLEREEVTSEIDEESIWRKLNLNGYLKNETAYRFAHDRAFTKIRNTISLNSEYPVSENSHVYLSVWGYYDLVYDLLEYDTISPGRDQDIKVTIENANRPRREKDNAGFDIREFYFDWYLDHVDVRIGKQFVVWGVFEGVRITDEINPQDFRELILPELLDFRVPLWKVKIDYSNDDHNLQLLWIPDIQFHKFAPPGSEWELTQDPCLPDAEGNRFCDARGMIEPESFRLENSEIGLRYTTQVWDAEISFSYFYTWDDFPVLFRHVDLTRQSNPVFFPTYSRIHMYGSTFEKQIGPVILKSEMAYVTGKYFAINNVDQDFDLFLDHHGELKKDHLRWGVGADFIVGGWDLAFTFVEWKIFDYEEGIVIDEHDHTLNLFVRRSFPEKSVTFQMLYIYMVNFKESYIQPKLIFQLTDQFTVTAGADLFFADRIPFENDVNQVNLFATEQRSQFFGEFERHDRAFIEFKYGF